EGLEGGLVDLPWQQLRGDLQPGRCQEADDRTGLAALESEGPLPHRWGPGDDRSDSHPRGGLEDAGQTNLVVLADRSGEQDQVRGPGVVNDAFGARVLGADGTGALQRTA